MKIVVSNVGELIEALKLFPEDAGIYTMEPPFDGLAIVPQSDGALLFIRPREPERKMAVVKNNC